MGIEYQKSILSFLVDWYEKSPAYIRGQKPTRRRMMILCDDKHETDFPPYNIEDPYARNDINQAVLDLAKNGIVGYEWLPGRKNHILARVWLNAGAIDQAYARLKRRPKGDETDELLLRMTELFDRTKTEWARRWLNDTIADISRKRSIGISMPGTQQEQDDLLKAVSFLADNAVSMPAEIEILERIFSMRCFGDSKHFERTIKTRLVKILKKYLVMDDCTEEEALRSAGIVSYPEQFAFSGDLSIVLPRGTIGFSPLPFGGTLTIDDVKQGQLVIGQGVRKILTVENRANYVDYVHKSGESGELVLYLGGQFSPAKRFFLQKTVSSMPAECGLFHWGDIDYGGFLILSRLRREIFPAMRPWRMGKGELIRYAGFTTGFTGAYRERLASLLEMPELSDCYPCIEYMMKNGVRLEQEAMLT